MGIKSFENLINTILKMSKTALIFGISGQDGAYLAQLLIGKGYKVHGTSRDVEINSFSALKKLAIFENVNLHSVSLTDFRSILEVIEKVSPNEIYNLAGQSSVGLSFEQPETLESISIGTINILESIRFLGVNLFFIMLVLQRYLVKLEIYLLMKIHLSGLKVLME